MTNDYNGFTAPEGVNYINGFSYMSNDDLAALISTHGLSFSLEQMIYIRDYFRNVKKIFPTYSQLFFFDEINKIRKSQKNDYAIYSATSRDGATPILEASRDLLSKRGVINRRSFGAMPISSASEIASEYLKHVGCAQNTRLFAPAKSTSSAQYYIHSDEDAPLFTYTESPSTIEATSIHNTLAMLCPTDEFMGYDAYCESASAFTSLPEIYSIISEKSTVKAPYGIFEFLAKESSGVFVNLSTIPEIEKDDSGRVTDLRSAFNSCIGRFIFSTSNTSIGVLNRIAEQYSLKICIFAIRNNSLSMTFDSVKNPIFSFDFGFINAIMGFKEHKEYIFSDESDAPLGERISVYLTDSTSLIRQTHRAEKILNFGKVIASATGRVLNASPHRSAAIAIVDVINTLVAKGAPKDAISLSIHYTLLGGTDDSIELGKNLAAILGAYRSMIELCVSDSEPQINYSKHKRSIVALASAKTPIRPIGSCFKESGSHLYFYELKFSEDGLPDYKQYRAFLKLFYSLIENDAVHSAFAINENLSSAIQGASTGACIDFNLDIDAQSLQGAHGVLFELNKPLDLKADTSNAIFKSDGKNLNRILDDIFYIGRTCEKY